MKKTVLIFISLFFIVASIPMYQYVKKKEADYNKEQAKLQSKSKQYYNRAFDCYQKNQLYEAKQNLDQSLSYYKYDKSYILRAVIYEESNQLDKAIEDYGELIKIDEKNKKYYNSRGYLYYKQKKYDQALKDFDQSLTLNKNQKDIQYYTGLIYQIKKEYKKSLEVINELIAQEENDDYYILAAEDYFYLKKYKKTIEMINKCTNKDEYLLELLGDSYYELKDYKSALNYLNQVTPSKNVYYKQALCYYYLKDYEQALVCFGKYDGNDKKIQKIIEDCKKQENVIQQEGVTNENMQSSGIQKESDYIESNKELLKYENYNKAVKYYEEKNYEQAIVYLKKYIKETQNQEAKYFLAYLYHLSDQVDQAIQMYSECIDHGIQKGNCYYSRGILYLQKKEYKKAVNDFQDSYDLGIKKDYSKYNQGVAYMNQSLFKESTKCFIEVRDTSSNEELVSKAKDILSRYYVT